MHLETLESRTLFAGVLRITTTGDTIVVRGDDAGNNLRIFESDSPAGDGTPSGGFHISAETGGTLIVDGQIMSGGFMEDHETRPEMGLSIKPWRIDLGAGDDSVEIVRYEDYVQSISAKLGTGEDFFYIDSHFYPDHIGAVAVDGGAGNDTIYLGNIGGNVSIFSGPGRDKIRINADNIAANSPEYRLRLQGKLQIVDTQGPTEITMSYVDVRKDTLISTSNSVDRITMTGVSFRRNVTLFTHNGVDVVINVGSRFRQNLSVLRGIGKDIFIGFEEIVIT